MPDFTFHLIGNAHIDPVWLWDWREGLNEGLITCRGILDLMDEYTELTFSRGEASIYEHIEATDTKLFKRILHRIEEGRWEPVGGTYVQSDTNLPATETFVRQFIRGQQYFSRRLGSPAAVAWFADSFGHSAGLCEIMAACGIRYFAFTRPNQGLLPISRPAFWWQAASGARILCYRPPTGWYGTDRTETINRLDGKLLEAKSAGLHNVAIFHGLGNHGGGPTRRQLKDIADWGAKHPDVRLQFSTMQQLFQSLEKELAGKPSDFLPVHHGEMNFCLRGCYSSVARMKYAYRRAESQVQRAGITDASIRLGLSETPTDFSAIWEPVLFNSFHDILPGSSIERAYDEQLEWLGTATHAARKAEFAALNALAERVDTSVQPAPAGDMPTGVAALLWNPNPFPFQGYLEIEARLDYRPIYAYWDKTKKVPIRVLGANGRALPFQRVKLEHNLVPTNPDPSHCRLLLPVRLPAAGWNVVEIAYREDAKDLPPPKQPALAPRQGVIEANDLSVIARKGSKSLQILHKGKPMLGDKGLQFVVTHDPWGSWGGMNEEAGSLSLNTTRETWKITDVKTLEHGHFRAALWIRIAGARSRIDLTVSVTRDRPAVDVSARIHWDERSARLKMIMPMGREALFDVPGGSARRSPCGEVPGGRWVEVQDGNRAFGFASDSLYNFEVRDGSFNTTLCRASRYSSDVETPPEVDVEMAATDNGELKLRFLFTPKGANVRQLARELEQPPVALLVLAKPGEWARSGSLITLVPNGLTLLAIKAAEKGNATIVRIHNTTAKSATPVLTLAGRSTTLTQLRPNEIGTWRLTRKATRWLARRIVASEL